MDWFLFVIHYKESVLDRFEFEECKIDWKFESEFNFNLNPNSTLFVSVNLKITHFNMKLTKIYLFIYHKRY